MGDVYCIRGVVQLSLHNESGEIIDSLTAGPREAIQTIEIQPCEVHSLRCLSDKALLLEIKEGPFDPNNAKTFIL